MPLEKSILPWKPVTTDGYGKLDLILKIGGDFGALVIARQRPSDENAGAFTVWHNENRIGERFHSQRTDAIAEAERYFYDHPQFAGSANAGLVAANIELGRQGYRDGKNLYQNPFTADKAVERSQWAEGWLQAYAAPTIKAAMQSALQLNGSLAVEAHVLKRGITYALECIEKPRDAIAFLREWATSDDPEGFNAKYPEWPAFRDAKVN